jgi:uncharacterized protein YjbI with pentapeptide repeats
MIPMRVTAIVVAGVAFLVVAVLIFGGVRPWGISEVVGAVGTLVGVGGLYLSYRSQRQQQELELQRASQQRELEQYRASLQQEFEHRRSNQQRELEEQQAEDAALQAYFDQIGSLLTEHNLATTKRDDIKTLASTQTEMILRRLDASRKRDVILFLDGARLIDKNHTIVNLGATDLNGVDLTDEAIIDANFNLTSFSGADLSDGGFGGSYFWLVDFTEAKLRNAELEDTKLKDADFSGADLSGATLTSADLSGAKLKDADLSDAWVTQEQLDTCKSLKGTTMPDGTKHP